MSSFLDLQAKMIWALLLTSITLSALPAAVNAAQDGLQLLDSLDDISAWRAGHSDEVAAALSSDQGALCLDFDFNGVSGYATLSRALPISFSGNFAISFRVRGTSPANTLQLKLIDPSGPNVWWIVKPDFTFNGDWQTVRAEKRQISFAWGPAPDRTLRRTAVVEFVLAAGKGGRGHVCFDDLKLESLPPEPTHWPAPVLRASTSLPQSGAALAMDGNPATAWRSDPLFGPRQVLEIDFGAARAFGGLVLHWLPGLAATRYEVQFSDDGRQWRTVRRVTEGNGGEDPLLLTESHTRYVRIVCEDGPAHAYCLSEIDIKDLDWGESPNRFFTGLAKTAPRGVYPRSFTGEQAYWTIVGVDGGGASAAMISEDGAVELSKGGFSVEPFLVDDGRLVTWADVHVSQDLAEGYLPMPGVTWRTADLDLNIAVFVGGTPADSRLLARYTVENHTNAERKMTLALTARPFQVNPATQFLNSPGGTSPIHELAFKSGVLEVDGQPRVFPLQSPDLFVGGSFDAGNVVEKLAAGPAPVSRIHDDFGFASGAMLFHLNLPAQGRRSIDVLAPLSGGPRIPAAARQTPEVWLAQERSQVAARWRARLNAVGLQVPDSARDIANTVRTSLAYILISRDGPALEPGIRAYARTWVRDGAMMSEALLRMGLTDVVRDFVTWYAPHQFGSGKVPCCVDARGSDPVPENDSQGELIFTIAELYRFTGDKETLESLWPHVARAVDYMERLRAAERTPANATDANRAYYGLMPASISHEGYAAKPVHSYWDDFWALIGYDDAVDLARALGKTGEAEQYAAARDQFRQDLHASLRYAAAQHGIDYLPGSAELGDFDPTSTTIALSPGREQAHLPQDLLTHTFERYWQEFVARRDGRTDWQDYTPYELRNVAVFVRLGWRARVQALLDFFMADRRPAAWNGWAEVVRREPRKPGFIGDMPHAWIASDYIRSVLDMFAYTRARDSAVVLAAGVPPAWLAQGFGLSGLRTPWGRVGFSLRNESEHLLHLRLDAQALPPGGYVLTWPYAGQPGRTWINGQKAQWRNGELHIDGAHAEVIVLIPGTTP